MTGLVKEAARAYTRRADSKYNRWFTRALGRVTADQLEVAAKRLMPLFLSPESTLTAVVCNKGDIGEVVGELEQWGYGFTTYDNLEETFLATEDGQVEEPRL